MKLIFNSLPDLIKRFPDDSAARTYLEKRKWHDTPVCPHCGCIGGYKLNDGKTYKCKDKLCRKKFTVTVGTIMENSNIPLNTWFAAIYIATAHKKGISSVQLAKDLGITQKSAWFMLHRIREMVRVKRQEKLTGIVEADETYLADKSKAERKRLGEERLMPGKEYPKKFPKAKGVIFGMIERNGRIIVKSFADNNGKNIRGAIKQNVEKHSFLFTDESNLYNRLLSEYKRFSVNHSREEWVRGDINTNHIENFWSVMKRGIYGIYHQVSYKHLHRYCDEFSHRFNNREFTDPERFVLSLENTQGRLKYKNLISGISNESSKETNITKEKDSEWE